MQDLQSSLLHAESFSVACELLVMACGIQLPDQGSNLGPLHWEHEILATGPSGKSHKLFLYDDNFLRFTLSATFKYTLQYC